MQVAIGAHFPPGVSFVAYQPFPIDNPNIYGNTLECSLANYTHAVIPTTEGRSRLLKREIELSDAM